MDKKLLYKFFEGSTTDDDVRRIREWVELSPENHKELIRERKLYDAMNLLVDEVKLDDNRTRNIQLHTKPKAIIRLQIPQIAAMIAVVFMAGILAHKYIGYEKIPQAAWYETVAPLGAKSQITLIDGTKIWLNAGSHLFYSTDFGQRNREVRLDGEAYFEVAQNLSLPFEVITSELKVKAVGTSFNVKAYPGEATIETILVEGEVEVTQTNKKNAKKDEIILLHPEQRLTLTRTNGQMIIEANLMINTSWKDKRWRIESEELGSFATKLERRFNVKIIFEDTILSKYRFNGTFEDEPLEEVLRALSLAAPVQFSLKGNQVTLSRNKKFNEAHQALYEQFL